MRAKLATGETFSWSVALPLNPSDRDPVIRAVDSWVSATFDVLAIVATYGSSGLTDRVWPRGRRTAFPDRGKAGWPTYEFPTREIVGAVVPSERNRTCASHPSISVGVRRTGVPTS